jgi:hypothetical protein
MLNRFLPARLGALAGGNSSIRFRVDRGLIVSILLVFLAACHPQMRKDIGPVQRDINAVLEDHKAELMALPGVVGVCTSLLEDQKTECIKVLLARKDRNLQKRIPRMLEGYRVVTEVTGEFRPMGTR